jgi:cytochrome c7-like protein
MDRSYGIFALALTAFLVGGILMPAPSAEDVVQPIDFNHRVHTEKTTCWECHFICEDNRDEDGELDCDDCEEADGPFCAEHLKCPDHKLPGLPQTTDCLRCHIYDLVDLLGVERSADEAPADRKKRVLFDYVEFDEYEEPVLKGPIPWQRVTTIDTSCVYFSHRTHALVAEIECSTCHGDVGSMTSPPKRPDVAVSMSWCLDCHTDRSTTAECASCHR